MSVERNFSLGPNLPKSGLKQAQACPKMDLFEPCSKTVKYFFLISSLKVKAVKVLVSMSVQ